MTQPIQEPMTQRSISSLRWGENQLYRRPRPPGGVTPIPWVRLKQLNQGQTWTTNDEQFVYYDDVCYSTDPDGTEFFTVVDRSIPGDNAMVQPLVGGIFQMTFMADFDNAPLTGCELLFNKINWNDDNRQYSSWIAGYDSTPAADGIPINSAGTGYGELTFRTESPDAVGDPLQFYVSMNTYASGMSLEALAGPPVQGSTYWEVRYLGAADTPFGLDNNQECTS